MVLGHLCSFRSSYQPIETRKKCSGDEVLYDGFCFNPVQKELIKEYTNQQLMITGILIMPPHWARRHNTKCKQSNQDFCAPDEAAPFGRFAGFLASYFNGQKGRGRVSEFVIMNEVNAAEWYNIGCGNGTACDVKKWVHSYAQVYNAAYDSIRKWQPQAPVMISFQHDFASKLDKQLHSTIHPVSEMLSSLLNNNDCNMHRWSLLRHSCDTLFHSWEGANGHLHSTPIHAICSILSSVAMIGLKSPLAISIDWSAG